MGSRSVMCNFVRQKEKKIKIRDVEWQKDHKWRIEKEWEKSILTSRKEKLVETKIKKKWEKRQAQKTSTEDREIARRLYKHLEDRNREETAIQMRFNKKEKNIGSEVDRDEER